MYFRLIALGGFTVLAAACGGGGGGSAPPPASNPPPGNPPPANPPTANKSAGGIWHGISTNNETITAFVAETGELRAIVTTGPPGANPPSFGSGSVLVAGDRLSGAIDLRRPFYFGTTPPFPTGSCELSGTVSERVSLSVTIQCTNNGVLESSTVTLGYNFAHTRASSLALIEGTYTLPFNTQTNILSINATGQITGVYHNGWNCVVNGTVAVIDAAFNLYRFDWQLANCQPPLVEFEGATFAGFGSREPNGAPPDSFIAIMTGVVAGRLEGASVLYQPP